MPNPNSLGPAGETHGMYLFTGREKGEEEEEEEEEEERRRMGRLTCTGLSDNACSGICKLGLAS